LDRHIGNGPFLFGQRPAAADFGLYGQLTQLAAFDPTPSKLVARAAPRVLAWVQTVDDLSGLEPSEEDWIDRDAAPQTLRALLAEAGRTYVPALLANARAPLIIAQRGTGSKDAFVALTAFVEDWAIPVSHYWANQIAIPMSSPCHVEWTPDDLLREADVVLALNALAPWWPDRAAPGPNARIIHLGPDPLFARSTPIRGFRCDIALVGEPAPTILALIEAGNGRPKPEAVDTRRAALEARAKANREAVNHSAKRGNGGNGAPMTKDWVSLCLGQAIRAQDRKASVFHELGCPLPPLLLEEHQSYFQEPHSGGLGWGLPAALGAQWADRDRLIFATMGDGSYIFANPVACHQVAEAHELPVITLVLNNGEWGAVRHSVESLYKDGHAARSNDVPLTSLQPGPDFTKVAEASRAYTETVTKGDDLPAALDRAIAVATNEKRQVLLDIAIDRASPRPTCHSEERMHTDLPRNPQNVTDADEFEKLLEKDEDKVPTIDEIIDCLNREKIRCTYGAVAGVFGIRPQAVGELLGEPCEKASWVVNEKTGLPSGFNLHPDLLRNPEPITEARELERLLAKGEDKAPTIDEIIDCLNREKIRCTYGAVAKVLGIIPVAVGKLLGKPRKEASWVVNEKTRLPSGYNLHPDLLRNPELITEARELERLLARCRRTRPAAGEGKC